MKLLFLAAAFGLTAVALGAGNGPLTVLELKGDAQVTDPGGSRPLTVAQNFIAEATVLTRKDSTVTVWLGNGSKLMITPESEVTVKALKLVGDPVPVPADGKSIKEASPSYTEIEVVKGKVIGEVKRLALESVYILKTPVGTVKIRGTVFAVEYRLNLDGTATFNVGCARGLVQVEMPGMKNAVAVKPGQQMSVTAAAPPPASSAQTPPPPAKDPPPDASIKPSQSTQAPPPPQVETPPPPAPPAFKMTDLPPSPEITAAIVSHGGPPPPPPAGPPPAQSSTEKIADQIQKAVENVPANASPTGG